jgi:hypothetical protein
MLPEFNVFVTLLIRQEARRERGEDRATVVKLRHDPEWAVRGPAARESLKKHAIFAQALALGTLSRHDFRRPRVSALHPAVSMDEG